MERYEEAQETMPQQQSFQSLHVRNLGFFNF